MAGPLKNIKVLDLSRVLAGPWASQILADMGAEVLKVEKPGSGDDTRAWGPPYLTDADGVETSESAYYLSTNRGKRSIAIDITTPEGQKIIKKLASEADILVENFKVGGLKKYRLDYDSLAKINPALIYCSITGFGQTGPRAEEAGYDFMIQGMGGLMSFTGHEETGPLKTGVAIADLTTGMYAAIAILGALHHRNNTGAGQFIDMALLDVQASWLANQGMNHLVGGFQPKLRGNAHPNIVPYQSFETIDGYIIVAVGNDKQFEKLCRVLGQPDLAGEYKTNRERVENRDKLVPVLVTAFKAKTRDQWLELLHLEKIPAGPINNLEDVFADEQIIHREMVRNLDHPLSGKVPQVATPIKYSKTELEYKIPPPLLGQHTVEVLTELGLNEEAIKALKDKGVVS
ncbi:MAG: CaiB/BaiF CoA transferase family protein [Alphaproteobacteria bacterium]